MKEAFNPNCVQVPELAGTDLVSKKVLRELTFTDASLSLRIERVDGTFARLIFREVEGFSRSE